MSKYNNALNMKKSRKLDLTTSLAMLFIFASVATVWIGKPVFAFPFIFLAIGLAVINRIISKKTVIIGTEVKGTGRVAKPGNTLSVHYTGLLGEKGKSFDSSLKRGKPIQLTLGAGQVIKGWDIGLEGMREGEKRRLIIPPALAYGKEGSGDKIPPDSKLVFDVELLSVKD
jgi:hypothetical protein